MADGSLTMRTESRLEAPPQIVHQPMVGGEFSKDGGSNGLDVRVRSQIPVVGHLQAAFRLLRGEKPHFQPFPEALLGRIADNPLRRSEVCQEKLPEALKGVLETLDCRIPHHDTEGHPERFRQRVQRAPRCAQPFAELLHSSRPLA